MGASGEQKQNWIGPLRDGEYVGFIDWSGKWVLQIACDDLGEFREGLAPFRREGKIGFLNESGVEVIRPTFTTQSIVLPGFQEGLAPVDCEEGSTYINHEGAIVMPPRRETTLWNFVDGKAITGSNSRFAIIDRTWTEISVLNVSDVPFFFHFPDDWNCIPCFAGEGEGCGAYINWRGEFIFPPIYSGVGPFLDGIGPFSPDGDRFGLVRLNGEVILQPKYLQLFGFSEGVAAAQVERNKWGFIDASGEWAIEPNFFQALPFSEGLACVTVKGKDRRGCKGFIDRSGEFIIPARYHRQASFHNGWALVELEGRIQIIDKRGEVIWAR